ncbi:hypothetical protein ACHAWF_001862, partial [Thalassiosira exigua]
MAGAPSKKCCFVLFSSIIRCPYTRCFPLHVRVGTCQRKRVAFMATGPVRVVAMAVGQYSPSAVVIVQRYGEVREFVFDSPVDMRLRSEASVTVVGGKLLKRMRIDEGPLRVIVARRPVPTTARQATSSTSSHRVRRLPP